MARKSAYWQPICRRGSASLLQRALGIGYTRASRLIDLMTAEGIVGDGLDDARRGFDYPVIPFHVNCYGRRLIAGEAGYSYRSYDDGQTWEMLNMPYLGSMWGALALNDECVLFYGLRGHALQSCDFGNTAHHPDDAPFACNNKLIGARGVIYTRLFHRIARVTQVNKIDALDDTPVLYIKTGNDSFC